MIISFNLLCFVALILNQFINLISSSSSCLCLWSMGCNSNSCCSGLVCVVNQCLGELLIIVIIIIIIIIINIIIMVIDM